MSRHFKVERFEVKQVQWKIVGTPYRFETEKAAREWAQVLSVKFLKPSTAEEVEMLPVSHFETEQPSET